MYKRKHWAPPSLGRFRRGPPWPLGRIKKPVPNIRGGGPPVPNGIFDSPGGDLSNPYLQDPSYADAYANYGVPGPVPLEQAPQMAQGGVVTKPTVVRVGEREPEAVIKLCPRMSYQRRE